MIALALLAEPLGATARPPAPRPTPLPRWRKPVDPAPLVTLEYLELTVGRVKNGALKVLKLTRGELAKPQALLPRYRGRFEAKLYGPGGLLVDVVRFDFPLTGASDGGKGNLDPLGARLALGVQARVTVRVPYDAHRTTALVLYDAVSKTITPVNLSPVRKPAPKPSPSLDGGKLRTGSFRPPPPK
jgi:hypothetical protein